jgi:signal peptidase II
MGTDATPSRTSRPFLVLGIATLLVLLDQVSKEAVRLHLRDAIIAVVPGFFNLRSVQNTGAAWGIFSGFTHWLVVLSGAVLTILVCFRRQIIEDTPLRRPILGLMIGGIVGNMIDRVRLGHVVDFLDFHWGPHHFPAFNVADSAICVGVGLYILSGLLIRRRGAETAPGGPPLAPAGGDAVRERRD